MAWFDIPTFLMVWTLWQNGCILLSYGILMWHLSSQPHQLGYSLCSFPTTNYYKCQLKIGSGWKGLENSIHLCFLITSVQPKFTEELITTLLPKYGNLQNKLNLGHSNAPLAIQYWEQVSKSHIYSIGSMLRKDLLITSIIYVTYNINYILWSGWSRLNGVSTICGHQWNSFLCKRNFCHFRWGFLIQFILPTYSKNV